MGEVEELEECRKRHLIHGKKFRISGELEEVERLRREGRIDLVVVLVDREEVEGQ